nr:MAG TPA: hypothetical protein [Caudoviricetes sp.]
MKYWFQCSDWCIAHYTYDRYSVPCIRQKGKRKRG